MCTEDAAALEQTKVRILVPSRLNGNDLWPALIVNRADIRIYQAKGSNLAFDYKARGYLGCVEVAVWIGAERLPLQLPLPLQIFNPKPMTV